MSDYDAEHPPLERTPGRSAPPPRCRELVNEADLDWPNIAEEIEDAARSELRAVELHLLQALLHNLKAEAWPLSNEVATTSSRLTRRTKARPLTWLSHELGTKMINLEQFSESGKRGTPLSVSRS